GLCETEVEHFDRAVGRDLDVCWLEVSMNDALVMCSFERLGNLSSDVNHFIYQEGTGCDPVGEGWAFHQLENEREDTVRLLEAVDSRDVRMIERRQYLSLSPESRHAIRIEREQRRQDLECDLA